MSKYEKYKESGVEWIGEVPEHWVVKRLKNLATNISSKSTEILDDDFIVALENIESNTGKFIESSSEYENNGIIFKESQILYNKLRPYLNKVYLAKRDGICVGDIIVVECFKILYPKFLQYKMLSDAFCAIVMSSVQGTKMPRTSWEFISSLKFGIPKS
ncbi:MAG: restriction endonuclease subunit S [Saprospiraceae bacterium]|nr:restriction endonuclease subunit S [Candidatus Vicinibacter affinis]